MAANRKRIASELSALLDGAQKSYDRALERDHMQQAQQGASVITKGFAFPEMRDEAHGAVFAARDKAMGIIASEIDRCGEAMVSVPDGAAAAYVNSISGRSDMTADECAAALSKYRDHATQKAIQAAAMRSGLDVHVAPTDAERDIADLRQLADETERTFAGIANGTMLPGAAVIAKGSYKAFGDGAPLDAVSVFRNMSE